MHVNPYSEKCENDEKTKNTGEKKICGHVSDSSVKLTKQYFKTHEKEHRTNNNGKRNSEYDKFSLITKKKIKIAKEENCEYELPEYKNSNETCEQELKENNIKEAYTDNFEEKAPVYALSKNFQRNTESKKIQSKGKTSILNEEESIEEDLKSKYTSCGNDLNEKILKENKERNNNDSSIHVIRVNGEIICEPKENKLLSLETSNINESKSSITKTDFYLNDLNSFHKKFNSQKDTNFKEKTLASQKEDFSFDKYIFQEEITSKTSVALDAKKIEKENKRTTYEFGKTYKQNIFLENIMTKKKRISHGNFNTNSDFKNKVNNDSKNKTYNKTKKDLMKNGEIDDSVLFTPKKSGKLLNIQKKEIEEQLLQTINEENEITNNLWEMKNKGNNLFNKKLNTNDLLNKTLSKKKESNVNITNSTALSLISQFGIHRSNKMSTLTNFHVSNNNSFHMYNSNCFNTDNKLEFLLRGMNNGSASATAGLGSGNINRGSKGIGGIGGIKGIGAGGLPSFLRNSTSGTMVSNELKINTIDYDYDEEMDEKLAAEYKKDICFLLRELIDYCDYLKDRKKSDQREITKIRCSYNEVCKLLKEALSRETQNQEQILKLRENVEKYNERLKNLQCSKEEHTKFYNKKIEDLITLNCRLEEKLQDIASENQKLKKIAKTSLQYSNDNNELKNKLEEMNGEYSALLMENDYLKLENSKIENEKNVLVAEKNSMHCKMNELENELKRKAKEKEKEKEKMMEQMGSSPFIINSDDELKEQLEKYLSLNADQRVELFANFLEHWRITNIEGQKFYQLAYMQENQNITREEDEDEEEGEVEEEEAEEEEAEEEKEIEKEEKEAEQEEDEEQETEADT